VAVGLALVATLFAPGPLNNLVEYGIVYLNPLGISSFVGVAGALIGLGATSAVGIAVASVFGVRGRFKRATGEERQQLRWLRFVTTIAVVLFVALVIGALLIEVTGRAGTPLEDRWWNTLFVLIALTVTIGIPAAYLIAIFRHGLWDLDVVIRKTLVFGILVVLFMILGALVAVVLTNMAIGTLYDDPPLFLVIGLAFGLLATPLYRVSKRIADRIVYGGRATPYQVLTDFSGRIGETYATDDVLQRMAQVLADGTGASSARVLLRVGADLQEAASVGHVDPADEHSVTVVHQGEELGALAVTMPASDPMSPSKELLIRDLARQTGPVLRNVRLIEELRESRRRLVVAQDEERRRLERNIHDGIQQQLVALQVQLRLARTLLDRDHTKVGEMLDALQGASVVALEDLRDLARGIYPPLLADKGLAAALESQARKAAVPTSVEAEGMRRYQQDVEATVYFCALEALNNVAKYADASSATVSISQANGALTFEVRDDGRGFDPATVAGGTGMQGMADRLAAVGGELRVTSAPGHGTVVTGRIPLEVRT
jgi:signal transduction histidine kinase